MCMRVAAVWGYYAATCRGTMCRRRIFGDAAWSLVTMHGRLPSTGGRGDEAWTRCAAINWASEGLTMPPA